MGGEGSWNRGGTGARMAFMLHAPAGCPREAFFDALRSRRDDLVKLGESFGAQVRVGTKHPLDATGEDETIDPERPSRREPIEGAVEFTVEEARLAELSAHAGEMGDAARRYRRHRAVDRDGGPDASHRGAPGR